MLSFLAKAEVSESGDTSVQLLLVWAGVVAAVAVAAFIPARLARSGRYRQSEIIVAASVLWGILAAGSVIYYSIQQTNWSRERLLQIQTGYYDVKNDRVTVPFPWPQWVGLGTCYLILIGAAVMAKPHRSDTP